MVQNERTKWIKSTENTLYHQSWYVRMCQDVVIPGTDVEFNKETITAVFKLVQRYQLSVLTSLYNLNQ